VKIRAQPSMGCGRNFEKSYFMLQTLRHLVYLENLIAVVIDDLYGNLTRLRFVKGAADCAVKTRPSRFVDLGPQRPLELVVGLIRACKVGVAHEKALSVVVGIDKPARDVVCG